MEAEIFGFVLVYCCNMVDPEERLIGWVRILVDESMSSRWLDVDCQMNGCLVGCLVEYLVWVCRLSRYQEDGKGDHVTF